ncbi:ATP-binding protein [Actinocorallia sp. A-T 12471]|uniref:ATP-binding protein n=1 Tax=Actinocorallia sp. A-T 12471 TaxID=3089813 RepID=UPI0029CF772C|nr:NACHT domain-containing protein [Actinocorallia sp. A-T 12471]MDX6742210.1 NACHT domain-containing protein [Actinocorallia sp. A-T 12471]
MDELTGGRPGNLPPASPPPVGRAGATSETAALLRLARLVTVTGTAGIGKTRLALHVAGLVADDHPDGVWFVPLSNLLDAAMLPHVVAFEMKVRDQTARPMVEILVEHLADRRCLLVLDSCEHLTASCALLARVLLDACPGVTVLATSREPLDVEGEAVLALDPLAVPGEHWDGVADTAAVSLFVARVRDVEPGFAVTADNAAAIGALCRRLDGLPLALELAAAQVGAVGVAELAARPAAAPDAVGGGPWPRGSLWTAIGWSHELCTPRERLMWARASVFAGPFTSAAAVEVCGGGPLDDVETALDGLVRRSVLRREGGRYRLLDSLRDYGAAWLAELGETRALRLRHRDRYLDRARRAFPSWTGPEQVVWYTRIREDFPEIRLAVETCLAEPGTAAQELVGALWFFWFTCEHAREGRQYLERALADHPEPGPLRVRAVWALGGIMMVQGDLGGIGWCVRECRGAAPDPTALRAGDYLEGTDFATSGRPDLALERLVDLAAAAWSGTVQEAIWMQARAALAFARYVGGDLRAAEDLGWELRADGARRGEEKFRSWGDYMIALVRLAEGDHARAADHARSAFDGWRHLDDSANMALALEALAVAGAVGGEAERASVLLGISDRLWRADGGRDRFTAPQILQARREAEEKAHAVLGADVWTAFYRSGYHSAWPYDGR